MYTNYILSDDNNRIEWKEIYKRKRDRDRNYKESLWNKINLIIEYNTNEQFPEIEVEGRYISLFGD